MRSCETLDYSSSDLVNYPSSDFVTSEEKVVDCLKRIGEVMVTKNFAEATEKAKCEGGGYKQIQANN